MSEPIRVGPPDSEIYGDVPNPSWRRYAIYTEVREQTIYDGPCDRYTQYQLWLVVGHQGFRINSDVRFDSRKDAEWMAEMLQKALGKIVEHATTH